MKTTKENYEYKHPTKNNIQKVNSFENPLFAIYFLIQSK